MIGSEAVSVLLRRSSGRLRASVNSVKNGLLESISSGRDWVVGALSAPSSPITDCLLSVGIISRYMRPPRQTVETTRITYIVSYF